MFARYKMATRKVYDHGIVFFEFARDFQGTVLTLGKNTEILSENDKNWVLYE